MKKNALPLLIIALFMQPVSVSASESENLWTFTLGAGYVDGDIDSDAVNAELNAQGYQVQVDDVDDDRFGFSVWLGYQWHNNLRFEAGYLDFGEISSSVTGQVADPETFKQALADGQSLSAHGIALTVRPSFGLTDSLSAYGRVGPLYWKSNSDVESFNGSDNGIDWLVGAGIEWQFALSWALGFGWDRGHFDNDNADMFSLSVTYR